MPSLSRKFARNFKESIRKDGERLASGTLRLWGGDERIRCEFPADAHLTAEFRLQDRRLVPECGCDAFQQGRPCPHLWAAILLAERFQDLNAALKRSTPSGISFGKPDTPEEPAYVKEKARPARIEGHEDEDGRIIVPEPARPAAKSRAIPAQAPVREVSSSQREILYVLRPDKQETTASLIVDTWWRQPGSSQQPKPFCIDDATTAPTGADAEILTHLKPLARPNPPNRHEVPAGRMDIFDALSKAPLLRWADTSSGSPKMRPLDIPLNRMADFTIAIRFTDDARFLAVPALLLADERLTFDRVRLVAQGKSPYGFALADGTLLHVTFHGAADIARTFLGQARRILDYADALALSRRISLETSLDTSGFPEAIAMRHLQGSPTGELYVRTAKYKYKDQEQLHAVLSFSYDGVSCPDDNAPKAATAHTVIERSPEQEDSLRNRLRELGFRFNTKPWLEEPGWKLLPAELDNAVHTLVNEGWNITAEGKTYRRPVTKAASVRSGMDWFELESGVSFDGREVPLPELLAAYRSGARTVRLDDGTFGLLPMEWLERFTVLTEIGEAADEHVRFRISQAALVNAILDVRLEEGNARIQEQLREFDKLSVPLPSSAPDGFRATLRDYQKVGLGWLEQMQRAGLGACLADDMGLGKTIQVLALLAKRPKGAPPSLVVLPKSLIFNWLAEIRRFAPELRAVVHAGAARECSAQAFGGVNIVLTTYGTLRNDATRLADVAFDYCILDESQAIKNHESSTAKAARCIRAAHRITMTGTPVENNLGELFSQLDFLNPGLFGRGRLPEVSALSLKTGKAVLERIRKGVRPFILRRTKEDVAKELPPKSVQTVWCDLREDELAEYRELLRYYQKQLLDEGGPQASGMKTLAALTRLRQAACHPGLIKAARTGDSSSKLDVLMSMLETVIPAGHKALVFSQFTAFLKIIRTRLEETGYTCAYLDGTTKDREAIVKEFQENAEMQIFLISLKAGGVGLNLTAADYVFIMDPWWNPAAEAQAIDRAYRIGQKRPVTAYKIASKETIEEKVLNLQEAKRSLADAVINDDAGLPAAFTADDLRALLSDPPP